MENKWYKFRKYIKKTKQLCIRDRAIQIGLPKKSVSGITVIPMVPFGRNIECGSGPTIDLGNLYHMGHNEGGNGREQKVKIDKMCIRDR